MLAVLLAALPLHADKRKDTRTRVLIETTAGNITLALYDETPVHRDNFIKLVKEGFYDGLLFHRTIEGFMIQSGDPDSREDRVIPCPPKYSIRSFTTNAAHLRQRARATTLIRSDVPAARSSTSYGARHIRPRKWLPKTH